ncbi:MAG: glucose/arabinose dehydrogenase [Ulvibacter sp.]|jgi:glucose/arabinose dehydrogenase
MKKQLALLSILLVFTSCLETKDTSAKNQVKEETSRQEALSVAARSYNINTVVDNLSNPWGMIWLPDGSMLITEKSGDLIRFINGSKINIKNVPKVYNRGQGGLLDIELHPNYKENGWIYMTYASSEGSVKGGNTALIRCKLKDNSLVNIEKLYKAEPNTTSGQHFGSRIEFDNQGFLYFSIGERGERDINPQDITRDGGKVYRLNDDGGIPNDNPFIDKSGAKKAIFTYGNRNPQGMAKHPVTGAIWIHEHGPKGGDEVNILKKGANYGWPHISYGVNYSGSKFTEETTRPNMEQPIYYWTPSIAPCGMAFVTSDLYPDWKGHLLVGSLKFGYIELLRLDQNKIIGREKIAEDIGRVRNVKIGPDGYIYIAIEGQGIVKVVPK